MSVQIINLTEQLVSQSVEDLLRDYPPYPHQEIFSNPYTRQRLVAQVLNRSRNRYVVLRESENTPFQFDSSVYLTEERLQIENLVHRKIAQIVKENTAIYRKLNALYYSSKCQPSNWFG
ncbi:MAG: hypothetical protein F6K42_07235 [Leptolyngbya sp. SIO1D8]|nr:hypothetical protein [Leptolyngbya sp. SIO1D8]